MKKKTTVKNSQNSAREKKNPPVKINQIVPVKFWTTRENFQKSGRENENSTREENRKKGQKGVSRALLIFTGKKENTAPHPPSNHTALKHT